jgi:ABC-type transport system involved in multi-copper enzyme maturation permease subunit
MPEGTKPYPRWDGPLANGPLVGTIARNEVRRAFTDTWSRYALIFIAAYTIVFLGNLYQAKQTSGDSVHTMNAFVNDFLNNLRWGALAMAAIIGGPALLDDQRRGALELYLSRSVSPGEYLAGKVVAVFFLSTLAMFIPALLYVAASVFFFTKHPAGWALALPAALLYSLIVGLMVSGLALGLSSISRSSRAATLILIGAFMLLDLVISNLLEAITRDPKLQILSPFAALQQQTEWIFKAVTSGAKFPQWWGVTEVIGLTLLGWLLLAWRHPRVRGEDRGSA